MYYRICLSEDRRVTLSISSDPTYVCIDSVSGSIRKAMTEEERQGVAVENVVYNLEGYSTFSQFRYNGSSYTSSLTPTVRVEPCFWGEGNRDILVANSNHDGFMTARQAFDLVNLKSLSNLTTTGENHFLSKDFKYIYPNGGTASSPASVTKNTRYTETNPYSGYIVKCVAEVKFNDVWGYTGSCQYYASSKWYGYGVIAHQLNNDSIIVQTGSQGIFPYSYINGNPFGYSSGTAPTSLPCRVKVWKIGKV